MTVPGQRHDRTALILYGSETGNSEDAAEELGRMAQRLHFVTRVSEMDLIEISQLPKYTVVVLVISTTGQGEFPRNARKFWKSLLRKRLPPGCLGHVSFTTFGLGDSSYPKYNWSARKLHKRLDQLGAKEIYARGEGDEQHEDGIDGTFINWAADLRTHLLSAYPLPDDLAPIPQDVFLPPKYILQLQTTELDLGKAAEEKFSDGQEEDLQPVDTLAPAQQQTNDNSLTSSDQDPATMVQSDLLPSEVKESNANDGPQLKGPTTAEPASSDEISPPQLRLPIPGSFDVYLVENTRITPEAHWQDVRQLTFLTRAIDFYEPGDTLTIYPKNFPEDVQAVIDLMEWHDVADMILTSEIRPNIGLDSPHLYPGLAHPHIHAAPNSTLRKLLTHNLDITAIPKRHFFELISFHTEDEMHRDRLREFSNPSFTDEFYDYATRPRRSILEVLQDFPTVKIPWRYALAYFPPIRGREYSISSGGILKRSHSADKGFIKIQLLVAIVKYKTVLRKTRQGLCSRYISSLQPNTKMRVTLKSGLKFYHPVQANPHLPVILIGTGTGLAPLRSLMWERALSISRRRLSHSFDIGQCTLFFGNRNRAADFFYEYDYTPEVLDVDVNACFSRDQREKQYVQDLIREKGRVILDCIDQKGSIYVCGSSGKMPKAVREALLDVIELDRESREEAEKDFDTLEKNGKFIQETW